MDKKLKQYAKLQFLGEGQFATVFKARDIVTDKFVAVKKIKIGSIQESKEGINRTALREIKFLRELFHPNVIGLIDVYGYGSNVSLVFDFMDTDLEVIIKDPNIIFTPSNIKAYTLMTFLGLEYLHNQWILHRDLKPNNLLVNREGILKIADFGLAKTYGSPNRVYTNQVVTRWYRSPELLFGAKSYGTGVDIWSMGCIIAELLLKVPFLPGESDLDQLTRIFQTLGSPTEESWPGMMQLNDYIQFKPFPGTPLKMIFSAASDDIIDLLSSLLCINPNGRLNSTEALKSPYFSNHPPPTKGEHLPLPTSLRDINDECEPVISNSRKRKMYDPSDGAKIMTTSEEKIKQFVSKYRNPDATKKEILKTCKVYEGLFCRMEPFEFSNGMKKDLANLSGTIPVPFKGKTYNIPICIWLMDTHPNNAPVCFVRPTPDMSLKVSLHLDYTGKVYLPYLHNWVANSSNLIELIQTMSSVFSANPPVYSKSKSQGFSSPYPVQSFIPGQGGSQFQMPGMPAQQYTPYPVTPQSAGYTLAPSNAPYPTQNSVYHPSGIALSSHPSYNYPYTSQMPPYPTYSTSSSSSSVTNTTPATEISNTGTITDEHIRASLMSAIEDKLRRKINEQTSLYHDEMQILWQTQKELADRKTKLEELYESLKKEKGDVEKNIQELKEQEAEIEKLQKNLSNEDPIEVDDAVLTTAPLYKQILNTYCEDLATEDTIYYVGEGLRKAVIDLDVFIKQLRSLSRKQLMLRALVDKCRTKAGLSV